MFHALGRLRSSGDALWFQTGQKPLIGRPATPRKPGTAPRQTIPFEFELIVQKRWRQFKWRWLLEPKWWRFVSCPAALSLFGMLWLFFAVWLEGSSTLVLVVLSVERVRHVYFLWMNKWSTWPYFALGEDLGSFLLVVKHQNGVDGTICSRNGWSCKGRDDWCWVVRSGSNSNPTDGFILFSLSFFPVALLFGARVWLGRVQLFNQRGNLPAIRNPSRRRRCWRRPTCSCEEICRPRPKTSRPQVSGSLIRQKHGPWNT